MALSELSRRPEAAPRFVRHRNADMESRVRLDEYVVDQTLIDFGEPIAVPHVVFDASAVDISSRLAVGIRVSDRRAKIINTLISSPDAPATPYWRDFMERHTDRIVRFARTATNKGMEVDPSFK